MIAKVCDREIRRDSWFENRLVVLLFTNDSLLKNPQPFFENSHQMPSLKKKKKKKGERERLEVGHLILKISDGNDWLY